jgi:polyketide biosynthesis 3-hydroxy-3-methylglutaryl-CoA synthase-like enzyme PksG
LSGAYAAYKGKIPDVDLLTSFHYFAFHTPFAGMVKGAHRKLMRENCSLTPAEIEEDFHRRASQSLAFCCQVGNVYSATTYLALCGLIDAAPVQVPQRVGVFSYGSGCSSEFYSGILMPGASEKIRRFGIQKELDNRYLLSMDEYDRLVDISGEWTFGTKDKQMDTAGFEGIYRQKFSGSGLLVFRGVDNYYRQYEWS